MTQQKTQQQFPSPDIAPVLKLRRRPLRPVFLKPERIQDMAQLLAGWGLSGGRFLTRMREFPTPQAAQFYGAFVGELSAALNVPADLDVMGSRVFLRLWAETRGHRTAEQATESVLGLAQHLG
jgi:hypothetical protein